ncbi:Dabb family protein [Trinickia mobilis]|uniref:Dabb family protein n=1 Tax=Trinickia mobilis TaxID=2816356 RepID=UPI001A8F297D|nr:Dabb family protein [Trinickia mobilis]
MIKHIVMWNVKGDTSDEKSDNVRKLKAAFEGLQDSIPGMTALEIGNNISTTDYACDVVLYSEFESREALEHYATHPAHLRVKQDLEGLRIARHQVDYAKD